MKRKSAISAGSRPEASGRDSSQYLVPSNLTEAVSILARAHEQGTEVEVIAGGTDVMVERFEELYKVDLWLALDNLEELKEIGLKDDQLEIGAGVTHSQLVESEVISDCLPLLQEAALDVGSPQIRNRGTIGGNIVTSSPAGDLLPPLLVYGADFELMSANGNRVVKAGDFFTGPKQNLLKEEEILTRIFVPRPEPETYGSWFKVGRRKALVISSLSLALKLTLGRGSRIKEAGLALGAVAPVPLRIEEISQRLKGKKPEEVELSTIAGLVREEISPIDDLRGTEEYRRRVAGNLVLRAFKDIQQKIEGC